MRRIARRIFAMGAGLIVFVLLLEVIGEATLALTGWEEGLALRSGQPHLVYDAVRGWKLRRSFRSDAIAINADGLRGPEIPRADRRDARRILVLGDSTTFGTYDCEGGYCPDADSLPHQLERAIVEAGIAVTVLNGGTEGYDSAKAWSWFREQLAGYGQDLVIVSIGWNDIFGSRERAGPSLRGLLNGSAVLRSIDGSLRRSSRAYRALWFGLQWARTRSGTAPTSDAAAPSVGGTREGGSIDPMGIVEFEANLREIAGLARTEGGTTVFLTLSGAIDHLASIPPQGLEAIRRNYGWEDLAELRDEVRRYNDAIRRVASSAGAQVVDLADIVGRRGGAALYRLPDIVHPTRASVAVLARDIAAELRSRGLAYPIR